MNTVVQLVPTRKKGFLVSAYRLRNVVMQVAVADMAEANDARTGNHFQRRSIGFVDEGGDGCDGHGYIVLDRATFRLLCPGHFLAHFPEGLRLRNAFADGRILNNVALEGFGQDRFQRRARIFF